MPLRQLTEEERMAYYNDVARHYDYVDCRYDQRGWITLTGFSRQLPDGSILISTIKTLAPTGSLLI